MTGHREAQITRGDLVRQVPVARRAQELREREWPENHRPDSPDGVAHPGSEESLQGGARQDHCCLSPFLLHEAHESPEFHALLRFIHEKDAVRVARKTGPVAKDFCELLELGACVDGGAQQRVTFEVDRDDSLA